MTDQTLMLSALAPEVVLMIEDLQAELARRNIPTWPAPVIDAREGVLSVWYGLVARTDGRVIWWRRPHQSSTGAPLHTFATTPETAAVRLAADYAELRARPLAELWQPAPQGPGGGPGGLPG